MATGLAFTTGWNNSLVRRKMIALTTIIEYAYGEYRDVAGDEWWSGLIVPKPLETCEQFGCRDATWPQLRYCERHWRAGLILDYS